MALSDTAARSAKPKSKPYKLADEKGLYLLVKPAGKYWRFDYRFGGKRKTLAFGVYPDVSLKAARDARDDGRKQIAAGIDPADNRKATKAAKRGEDPNSFEVITREWVEKYRKTWTPNHITKVVRFFEQDVFPWIGKRSVNVITAPEILLMLRRIESRGANEIAHRIKQSCGRVFHYAIATGRAERNPVADLRGAPEPLKVKHHAAITEPKAVGALLRALEGYQGNFITQCALRIAPLVFVRPGELCKAEWTEIALRPPAGRADISGLSATTVRVPPVWPRDPGQKVKSPNIRN